MGKKLLQVMCSPGDSYTFLGSNEQPHTRRNKVGGAGNFWGCPRCLRLFAPEVSPIAPERLNQFLKLGFIKTSKFEAIQLPTKGNYGNIASVSLEVSY